MKKVLFILALIIGLTSCGRSDEKSAAPEVMAEDHVEVIYFHGKQRCPTCVAIEKNTEEVVAGMFADDVRDGRVVYRNVDISTPEGEALADKYEVTWSSLFVNGWKDGRETRDNMTEFAFANAMANPDVFKAELADKISNMLQ